MGNISIVIGSWGSYNECNERALGSNWLDLSDYNDWEEIVDELKREGFELDGIDEELFIQDIEGIYYRITAYEPNHDFSIIMDTYGMFEKVWQFSADLIKRGLKILEVSSDEQFIDVNIDKLTEEEPNKFILRAHADGKPEYLQQNVGGVTYKAVKVGDKIYIPNN